MNQKQTQCKKIVEHIRATDTSRHEAYAKLDITQLAARITDLVPGFEFIKPRYKVGNCKNPVAHYSIARSESNHEPRTNGHEARLKVLA